MDIKKNAQKPAGAKNNAVSAASSATSGKTEKTNAAKTTSSKTTTGKTTSTVLETKQNSQTKPLKTTAKSKTAQKSNSEVKSGKAEGNGSGSTKGKTNQPQTKTAAKVAEKSAETKTKVSAVNSGEATDSAKDSEKDSELDAESKKIEDEIQAAKNEIELINIFNRLESKLIEILQDFPTDIVGDKKETAKTNIKSYIEKVNLASRIFDEYENTAKLIVKFNDSKEDDMESIEISKKVIENRAESESSINEKDLLKKVQDIEKETNGLEKVEIETDGKTVIVKKKKDLTKEM